MARASAAALLVVVLAISGISVPCFTRSCQLANLGSVRDGLGCWCTFEGTDKSWNFVEDDFDSWGRSSSIVVAGRLKSHIQFWRSIGASQFILDFNEHGYRILFRSLPPVSFSSNNKSALAHSDFVNEAISELLVTNCIFEAKVLPHNVNPLSVAVQSSRKKRSILDLRFINKHVWKQKVKFEDLKVALNYFDKGFLLVLSE